ncbi:MAG: Ger(x)C family spore germination protein [Bacillota bacterium]|nr:Ger(x)C family spore germination protein [Bacillota bacterium]
MRRHPRLVLLLQCLAACLFLAGCWDAEDPERTAHVVAIGMDAGAGGMLRFTFQVPVPAALAGGGGAAGGAGGGGGGAAGQVPRVWVETVEAGTVSDALRSLGDRLPRAPALSHLQVVVISERVARQKSMGPLWDFLTRDVQARRAAQLVVCRGSAEEVLRFQPRLADIPATGLVALLEHAADTGSTISTPVGRFGIAVHTEGIQGVAAMVELAPPESKLAPGGEPSGPERTTGQGGDTARGAVPATPDLRAAGLAVFRGDRMVTTLSERESRALSFVLRRARRPLIRAVAPDSGAPVTARVLSYRPEVKLVPGPAGWTGLVRLRVACELREELTPTYFLEPSRARQLETALAESLAADLRSVLRHTQEVGADVFGFGWWLYRERPREWFAVRESWHEVYSHLPVDVRVEVVLRWEGLTTKSPMRPGTPGGDR